MVGQPNVCAVWLFGWNRGVNVGVELSVAGMVHRVVPPPEVAEPDPMLDLVDERALPDDGASSTRSLAAGVDVVECPR